MSVCHVANAKNVKCDTSPKFARNLPKYIEWITVAVKVRHPNVEEIIDLDFKIMTQLAHCLEIFPLLRNLRLGESMSQFSSTIAAQTSLLQEGEHLQKVAFKIFVAMQLWSPIHI